MHESILLFCSHVLVMPRARVKFRSTVLVQVSRHCNARSGIRASAEYLGFRGSGASEIDRGTIANAKSYVYGVQSFQSHQFDLPSGN